MTSSRRTFLRHAGGSTAAGLMLGLPKGWAGSAYADDSPETKTMRFGIIALTDCSPIVMAHELGYFKQFGIESVVSKEASWAVIRDKLSIGENQAHAHADRHAVRVDDGPGRLAGQADGHPVAAQPQRPGDHPQQQAEAGRRENAAGAQADRRQGEGRRRAADVCDDVSARHARDVDALLAGVGRHSSGQGRQPDHHSAGADGRQHEGRQDGRLLRRRAVEQPRHRRRHRLHRDHDAADVAGSPGKGVRVHRGVRARRIRRRSRRCSRRCTWRACTSTSSRTAPKAARGGRDGRPTSTARRRSSCSGCSATTTTATAARSRTSST